jgi:soluble lytic murein transglycosylase
MQKKAFTFGALAVSIAAVAATTAPRYAGQNGESAVAAASMAPLQIAQAQPDLRPASMVRGNIAEAISYWSGLRQNENSPFANYAWFLTHHRGWPGEMAMRRAAERQINPLTVNPHEVVDYFRIHPPLTNNGHARHALALHAVGRHDEARKAALEAWHGGAIDAGEEARIINLFGNSFTTADNDKRVDALLTRGNIMAAQRLMPSASPAMLPLYDARIALQSRAPDAASRVQALGAAAQGNAGLVLDQATWLINTGQPGAARQMLAQSRTITTRPTDAHKWLKMLADQAKGASNDRQWELAYRMAALANATYEPGTDVSQRSFGERDEYTNLTWLGGMAALQRLRRPADAVALFEQYGRAAQSPQTQTKGLYWAGRSAQAAGQQDRARAYFQQAGRHFDQFYGQLALERLGQPLPSPNKTGPAQPSAADRKGFANRDLVHAIRHLGRAGAWRDQTEFLRALASDVKTDSDRYLAGELAQEIGRPDLGVLVARSARTDGSTDFKRWGFPEMRVPAAQERNWTLVHAITRQESMFDRQAVSHAGARGYMQLMPGTAREVAVRLGMSYEQGRLTSDTDYNVMLGSTYFAGLLNSFGGSYPLAVAAYNAGPGNVRKWIRQYGDPRTAQVDMIEWIESIPFFETRNYVQRVLENAVVYDLMHPNRAASPQQNRLSFYLGKQHPG